MNELDLLRGARPDVAPLDLRTKDHIRSAIDGRIEHQPSTASIGRRRRWRRSDVLAAVVLAAVLGGTAAAVIHSDVWSAGRPVAIPLDPGDQTGLAIDIPDPDAQVDPSTLASTVEEFAPAVRLPAGGSFDEWQHYATTYYRPDYPYETTRSDVAFQMVLVAQCQWAQQWLTATDASDHAAASEAIRVLPGIDQWLTGAGVIDSGEYSAIVEDMRAGRVVPVQSFENECAFRGAWGDTVEAQDAKATGDLHPAIQVVQSFLHDGDPADFDWKTGDALAHQIDWTDPHIQLGPLFPGHIYIAPTTEDGVMLVSSSESGTRFCAVITDASVERGIVDPQRYPPDPASLNTPWDPYPGPIACTKTD